MQNKFYFLLYPQIYRGSRPKSFTELGWFWLILEVYIAGIGALCSLYAHGCRLSKTTQAKSVFLDFYYLEVLKITDTV